MSIVKVSVLVAPATTGLGAKLLAKVGAGSTVKLAVAGVAAGRPAMKRSLVVLGKVPPVADAGTDRSTSKVQVAGDGPRLPPVRVRSDVPASADPAPQTPLFGRPVATRPGITLDRLSTKKRSETAELPRLERVNVSFTVPVATVLEANALVKVRRLILRTSFAALPVVATPTVPLTVLVVLVAVATDAAAGTESETRRVHEDPAARVPPEKVTVVVPVPEAVPPQSFDRTLLNVRPGRAAPRSSVKATPVAATAGSALLRVNSRVTVPPGLTGSSVNDLAIDNGATTVSLSVAPPTTMPPSAVTVLVVLVYTPGTAAAGTRTETLKVQEVPALRLPPE